jgi:hypothetical protein
MDHDHPETDIKLAEWVVTTCLQFGASVATAYQVAGLFIKGICGKAMTVWAGFSQPP